MVIKHTEVVAVAMPREDPEWQFALTRPGGEKDMRGFIVKLITDDDLVGIGYTRAVGHQGSSLAGVRAALETYTELLIGKDPFSTEKIFMELDRVLWRNNQAKAAIDLALYDLQARAIGMPVYKLLGGLVREEIPIIRILALKEPSKMAENARKLIEEGYFYIKIKLSGESKKDLSRVEEVRKAVGDSVHLSVDANQTYSVKAAIDTLNRMQEFGVELCEQPVKKDDWHGLAAVTQATNCIIEAHESASSLEKIYGLVKNRVVDSIFLTVVQLGGLRNAKTAAAICKLGNVSIRLCAVGSRIMSAASMHLVASTENISYACQLGEFHRLKNDPAYGIDVEHGKLRVPTGPGIGVSLKR